eukprot:974973-Prymnesium_polylepis.1
MRRSRGVAAALLEAGEAAGVAVDALNVGQQTALHLAAIGGDAQMVRALLAAGARADVPWRLGATCMHEAAARGALDVLELLLRDGVQQPDAADDFGDTPLHWAAQAGHGGACAALLRTGASPRGRNAFGATALHAAAFNGHDETMEL